MGFRDIPLDQFLEGFVSGWCNLSSNFVTSLCVEIRPVFTVFYFTRLFIGKIFVDIREKVLYNRYVFSVIYWKYFTS